MDDYFVRHPIFNENITICGYYLDVGARTRSLVLVDAATEALEVSAQIEDVTILSDNMMSFFEFSLDLLDGKKYLIRSETDTIKTVIIFGKTMTVTREQCKAMRERGYLTALHSSHVVKNSILADYADIIHIEFPVNSQTVLMGLIKQYKKRVTFLASRIETWETFEKAKEMGCALFQGYFFLKSKESLQQKEIKSLDTSIMSVLIELSSPEPRFHTISDYIEHDLGLSYRLLRLVNSAYMAPRYNINTIFQALTYIGLRELYQWVSMLMLNGIKNDENSELIKMSLIRGKLMALIAQKLRLPYAGSEPFFAGMFSLIDIILDKNMQQLLPELPLTEDVKDALSGKYNTLSRILSFIIDYEKAKWKKIDGEYPLNLLKPDDMVSLYLEALKWSKCDA